MDIRHTFQDIQFEWDSTKAESNLAKHSVDFETACETFFDPFVLALEEEQYGDELRETLIGMTLQWNILCVIYTLRRGDIFRIISARPATPEERRYYENQ
jgi:uncharacterized protein